MVVKKVVVKKKKRMEREVKLILGGIGAIALLLAGIIVVLTVDFGPEEKAPEPEKYSNLFIDEVRFVNARMNTRADADDHQVEATIYFTNDGDATAKNVELDIYALVTDVNMAEDSEMVKVGDVGAMKTKKATFSLDLPVGEEYKIDLLVFEDGMISKKGYGTVKIEDKSEVSAQEFKTTEGNKRNWDDPDDTGAGAISADDDSSVLCSLIVFLVIMIIFVVAVTSIWMKKKKDGKDPLLKTQVNLKKKQSSLRTAQKREKKGIHNYSCRTCGMALFFNKDYGKWWCNKCSQFVGDNINGCCGFQDEISASENEYMATFIISDNKEKQIGSNKDSDIN